MNRWVARGVAVLLPLLVVAGLAGGLRSAQGQSRQSVLDRFSARTAMSADFMTTYVTQQLIRERSVATSTMSGVSPTGSFADGVSAFGYQAAVLLDAQGRALAVTPAAPAVIGKNLSMKYAHLRSAVQGEPAVSGVVPSAAKGEPVVAFAVPFDTPQGRRVFSGAYLISDTPLGAYLAHATSVPGARLYITDAAGTLVATNTWQVVGQLTLVNRDAAIAAAQARHRIGYFHSGGTRYFFASHPVSGTPWTVLMAAPTGELLASLGGPAHWVPWLILLGLAVVMPTAGWLGLQLLLQRRQLAITNQRLEQLATSDELTGIGNRRHTDAQLRALHATTLRHGSALSVLMIDIDNFKRVNDTFGHSAGDTAIRHVTNVLSAGLRPGDVLGRWGGEEFCVILPRADLDAATNVAERLRRSIEAQTVPIGTGGDDITVTVSIGVAALHGDAPDVLVDRADIGLYRAKRAGRNQVCPVSAGPHISAQDRNTDVTGPLAPVST